MARIISFLLMLSLAAGCSDDSSPSPDSVAPEKDAAMDQLVDTGPVDDVAGMDDHGADTTADSVEQVDGITDDASVDSLSVDASNTCEEEIGVGSLTGTVDGKVLEATHSAGMKIALGGASGYDISFFAQTQTCRAYSSFSLSELWIMTCGFAPGTYEIDESCSGALSVLNQAGIPGAGGETKATSGTITIEVFDEACGGSVRGSFSVSFDGEQVTGTFDTISCGIEGP